MNAGALIGLGGMWAQIRDDRARVESGSTNPADVRNRIATPFPPGGLTSGNAGEWPWISPIMNFEGLPKPT